MRQPLIFGRDGLQVVIQSARVRLGPLFEHVETEGIEPVLRNATEYSAIAEAGGLTRRAARSREKRILDIWERVAVVVGRLREIALTFEQRRHAEAIDVAAALARTILVAVEEEPAVLTARLPDRASDGVAPVLLLRDRLWIAI